MILAWIMNWKNLAKLIAIGVMIVFTGEVGKRAGYASAPKPLSIEDQRVAQFRDLYRFHYGLLQKENEVGEHITPSEAVAAYVSRFASAETGSVGQGRNREVVQGGTQRHTADIGHGKKEIEEMVHDSAGFKDSEESATANP